MLSLPAFMLWNTRGVLAVGVVVQVRLHGAGRVDAVRRLDVHDGGAEVAEHAGGGRAGERPREVEHLEAVERRPPVVPRAATDARGPARRRRSWRVLVEPWRAASVSGPIAGQAHEAARGADRHRRAARDRRPRPRRRAPRAAGSPPPPRGRRPARSGAGARGRPAAARCLGVRCAHSAPTTPLEAARTPRPAPGRPNSRPPYEIQSSAATLVADVALLVQPLDRAAPVYGPNDGPNSIITTAWPSLHGQTSCTSMPAIGGPPLMRWNSGAS